ncbi:Ribosomal protein S13 [Giardia muris]|uniref:Ribosomal protein S13 n=1 Tax=Giardia muris TaxID=5742 RepID=A0A4Z1T5N4_GIAMU|nr:Ribosomal protein S13 [Giardia muris]|eukprot:TNJ27839.1 Ribosomal protein S13 [Giardia muris]
MGRMYSKGKGISRSAPPYVRAPAPWNKHTPEDVCNHIVRLAKKGMPPAKIGLVLRDQYAIGQVRNITGSKIVHILKAHGLAPEIPEDLYNLIKRAVTIRKHLERNRRDKDSKFRLILVESRIHRLSRYYRQEKRLPPTFHYKSDKAAALLATYA